MKSIEEIKADYHLFIDIQMGKYLKGANKSEFTDKFEANLVLGKIVEAYNNKIASDHRRLDNSDTQAKAAWFNSIEIDFKKPVSRKSTGGKESLRSSPEEISGDLSGRFPFLPPGSTGILLFIPPALEAYGLPFERFKSLLLGKAECTEIEEDIMLWAVGIAANVMGSVLERSSKVRAKFYRQALKIAEERLGRTESAAVVKKIGASVRDREKEFKGSKVKKGSKK
jgi:hypothetical protein